MEGKAEKNESLTLRETNFKGNSKSSLEYIRMDYRVKFGRFRMSNYEIVLFYNII